MWQNIKYYVLALAVILLGTSVSTGLQLLQDYLPIGHPVGALAANLSGVTLGSIIMVIGFLKDNRVDQERKRADQERKRADQERKRAETAEAKIAEEQLKAAVAETKAQQESELAERYLAELERFRESYEKTTEALIQLLQERDGNQPPNSDSTE